MFPTTVSFCTNAKQFSLTVDPDRFLKVNYRLQELCPDARSWVWVKGATRHPETGQFTSTMQVTVYGDYAALRRYLAAKLRVTEYALSEELLAELAHEEASRLNEDLASESIGYGLRTAVADYFAA